MKTKRLPTYYIPHGGGPCFFMPPMAGLPEHAWDGMASHLQSIAADVGEKPQAILVISAHWEAAFPTILNKHEHSLLYDYYGFPEHTYHLTYPARGSQTLAERLAALLNEAGAQPQFEHERGLDHGVFIPFKLIYPEADIPIVQLSLLNGLDAAAHIALGKLIAPLRDEGVLIVGSGMSYHNLRRFFSDEPTSNFSAKQFDEWLNSAVHAAPAERNQLLAAWSSAPGALESHPRSEHLIPLMVVAGAAESDLGRNVYQEALLGKPISSFRFG